MKDTMTIINGTATETFIEDYGIDEKDIHILETIGMAADRNDFDMVRSLSDMLNNQRIYEGELPLSLKEIFTYLIFSHVNELLVLADTDKARDQ